MAVMDIEIALQIWIIHKAQEIAAAVVARRYHWKDRSSLLEQAKGVWSPWRQAMLYRGP